MFPFVNSCHVYVPYSYVDATYVHVHDCTKLTSSNLLYFAQGYDVNLPASSLCEPSGVTLHPVNVCAVCDVLFVCPALFQRAGSGDGAIRI